jgi:hypothetical protein
MLNRLGIPGPQGEGAVSRTHQLLSRDRQLLSRNRWPAAAAIGTTATRTRCGLGRGGLSAEAQGYAGDRSHGWGSGAPFWCAADSGLEPGGKGSRQLSGSKRCMHVGRNSCGWELSLASCRSGWGSA